MWKCEYQPILILNYILCFYLCFTVKLLLSVFALHFVSAILLSLLLFLYRFFIPLSFLLFLCRFCLHCSKIIYRQTNSPFTVHQNQAVCPCQIGTAQHWQGSGLTGVHTRLEINTCTVIIFPLSFILGLNKITFRVHLGIVHCENVCALQCSFLNVINLKS